MYEFAGHQDVSFLASEVLSVEGVHQPDLTIVRTEGTSADAGAAYQNPIVPGEGRRGVPERTDSASNDAQPEKNPAKPPSKSLAIPDDLPDRIPDGLGISDLRGNNTEFFSVGGRPDLIVRWSYNYAPEDVPTALQAADGLAKHGVHVLPSKIVKQNDEIYVVTQRVDGVVLDDALRAGALPGSVLSQIDANWKGLSDRIREGLQTGEPMPADVARTFQYMYGTTASDSTNRIRLVDLPLGYYGNDDPEGYEHALLQIANEVNRIEQITGVRLDAARSSIGWTLGLCRVSPRTGDGIQNAIPHVLEHGERINSLDSRVHDFRTR